MIGGAFTNRYTFHLQYPSPQVRGFQTGTFGLLPEGTM